MDVPSLWKDTNIFYNILCFLITENEKCFDRNDAKLYWRTVLHVFAILHHFYISLFAFGLDLKNNPEEEIRKLYEFRFGLLTGWNFSFQTVFMFLALTHDILEWRNKQDTDRAKKIAYWRDVVFNGLVVPYTLFVTCMFWGVYSIDRELVFPAVFDTIVPWWFNHCVHTNITFIILIETILTPRRHPTDRSLELKLNSAVAFGYAIVYYSIYFITNRWLYNIFGIMNWWQVCLYQLLIWTSSYVFYFIHFPINRLIHGDAEKTIEDRPEAERNSEKTEGNGVPKSMEIGNLQKSSDFENMAADNWNLKYRSLRDKFENSRL